MVTVKELAARSFVAKLNFLIWKNSEAEAGEHWDMSVDDYVSDTKEGYIWDPEKYDWIPNE